MATKCYKQEPDWSLDVVPAGNTTPHCIAHTDTVFLTCSICSHLRCYKYMQQFPDLCLFHGWPYMWIYSSILMIHLIYPAALSQCSLSVSGVFHQCRRAWLGDQSWRVGWTGAESACTCCCPLANTNTLFHRSSHLMASVVALRTVIHGKTVPWTAP